MTRKEFIPISFNKQKLPTTFEETLNYLFDNEVIIGMFVCYRNDETGAPAFDTHVLMIVVLCAYSRGITPSHKIEQAYRTNIILIALSADIQLHFTTLAEFTAKLDKELGLSRFSYREKKKLDIQWKLHCMAHAFI
jgi:transposase